MFINYITLMLINMVAGLVILADFVYRGLEGNYQQRWIPGFGIAGGIALVTGLHMTLTWPVRGSFNVAYGETSVLFGAIFVGTAIALAQKWGLSSIAIYAFFAGCVSVLVGIRLFNLGLTRQPLLTAIGFILTGISGICTAPALHFRHNKAFRLLGVAVLLIAAAIWALTGFLAYWGHLENFQQWNPNQS